MSLTQLETAVQREPVQGTQYRVFYRVIHKGGTSCVRAIDVDTKQCVDEPSKLAELLAIKYILMHTNHAGVNRSGRNLQVNVSSGAIRKAQKKQTTNPDMHIHARFLRVRFADATIKTARKSPWVQEFNGQIENVSADDCIDPPIKTHVGEIHLTRHAVERFSERMNIPTLDSSWRKLSKMLTSSKWANLKPQKPLRTGRPGRTTETWQLQNGNSPAVDVVIVRNSDVNRIVTVIA